MNCPTCRGIRTLISQKFCKACGEALLELPATNDPAAQASEATEELKRLRAIINTITNGAEWCGCEVGSVTTNVNLWNLPNCDGRRGATLLDAIEKPQQQVDAMATKGPI